MILIERPPNFERIVAAFPDAVNPGVMFAYGGHIYSPSGGTIPAALMAHENVHLDNQREHANPDHWWDLYITDSEFRYREELAAHVAEYRVQLPGLDRNYAAKLLMSTAARLVAPLYAYKGKGIQQAIKDIRGFK